jgi:hypothetical protein
LLVRVGVELEEEFYHLGGVEPDGEFKGRVSTLRIFLVLGVHAGGKELTRSGQVAA